MYTKKPSEASSARDPSLHTKRRKSPEPRVPSVALKESELLRLQARIRESANTISSSTKVPKARPNSKVYTKLMEDLVHSREFSDVESCSLKASVPKSIHVPFGSTTDEILVLLRAAINEVSAWLLYVDKIGGVGEGRGDLSIVRAPNVIIAQEEESLPPPYSLRAEDNTMEEQTAQKGYESAAQHIFQAFIQNTTDESETSGKNMKLTR